MAANGEEEKMDRLIVQQELVGEAALPANEPVVLSCGGIYIPQGRRKELKGIRFHVLNVLNENEPIKLFSDVTPRNTLREVLAKESLN